MKLSELTNEQFDRVYRKAYSLLDKNVGGGLYGYDLRTVAIVHPRLANTIRILGIENDRRWYNAVSGERVRV